MNILHASTEPSFLERLRQMLGSAVKADIAVGYLFVSGFDAVVDKIASLQKVRILVGHIDRPTLDEVARGLQQVEAIGARLDADRTVRRSARPALAARAVESVAEGVGRLPQTDDAAAGVRRLADLVAGGTVEIKAYPRGVLHAKAYLCWYDPAHAEPGAAIVGSSNFSLAGFTGNTELNVRVTGDAEMRELGRWFEALWADSVDVSTDVLTELRRSWAVAATPPYHVYLKALYELYREEIDTPELEPGRRGVPELANFQLDAVRRALKMVDQHGGCFVGDVVGLGKTYVGAEIVRQLQFEQPPGRHPLIICPAGLAPMWRTISELFGLGAEIVSMSVIVPPAGAVFDEESGEYLDEPPPEQGVDLLARYPDRGIVLVDEAHNFRNPGTRRYAALSSYLWGSDRKVVLLSATPQNLGPADIYHQLRLFLDDLDHGLPLEPQSLEQYFAAIQAWYQWEVEATNWQQDHLRWQAEYAGRRPGRAVPPPPAAPVQPGVPFAQIQEVLGPVFLRRRRKDIRELYGDDVEVGGRRVQFPDPVLENLTYRLDKVYDQAAPLDDIVRRLDRHKGARYLASEYLTPAARREPVYRDLVRARNRVARLMRFLLFKRLESSVAAFRSTLDVLVRSNRNFRSALEVGIVAIGQTATAMLAGEDLDMEILLDRLQAEEDRRNAAGLPRARLVHPADDFDVARWLRDLDEDYGILETLAADVARVTPDSDDKLEALKTFLGRSDVAAGKVLIFSEAAATVEYLYGQLNPGGADHTIERLSGSNRDRIQSVVGRFAPTSGLLPGHIVRGDEIRILIATDVISEGQNLQDCNRVLNYDLHWNPVRLIQRFGRVDRIGTTHDTIYLHNTWPDTGVDAQLSLTERLKVRIQAFHDFIGLDAALLSSSERINEGAMYRIYEQQRLPEQDELLDEVASFQRGITLLQRIQHDDPALWETIVKLPDGIRSALAVHRPAPEDEAVAFFQASFEDREVQLPMMMPTQQEGIRSPREEPRAGETVVLLKHADRALMYAVDERLRTRQITPGQFIQAVECEPDTPRARLPEDTNGRVMAAYHAARQDARSRLGRARRPTSDTRLRRYLSRALRLARDSARDDSEELRRIGILQQIFLDHLPRNVLQDLEEVRRMQIEGASLIRRLEAMRSRYRLNPPDADESAAEPADAEVVRIVCSDGLVEG
jgi:hypothetical protein